MKYKLCNIDYISKIDEKLISNLCFKMFKFMRFYYNLEENQYNILFLSS